MPTVLERPQVLERPEVSETLPAAPEPQRTNRWLRWAGWLLAAAAVALIVGIVINANTDDGVVDTSVNLPANAVTADPKPRTPAVPAVGLDPRLGFGEDATATPASGTRLVEHAPGAIPDPGTAFMDEATITPGLGVGEPQGGLEFWERF